MWVDLGPFRGPLADLKVTRGVSEIYCRLLPPHMDVFVWVTHLYVLEGDIVELTRIQEAD